MNEVLISLIVIVGMSYLIYESGKKFADASSIIGDHYNLPRDVKGATFDAISSSLPELLIALYSVIIFKEFDVGIGTIAGSAFFNLLVIPGLAVFFAPVVFKVSRNVVSRDAFFYLVAVFMLMVLLSYFDTWGFLISLVLMSFYLIYVLDIVAHTKKFRLTNINVKKNDNISGAIFTFLVALVLIGIATYFLTDASIDLSHALGVPAIIIAFTVVSAATSVPDTVISIVNARKGCIDDAASNVFGSNIFNIFVGLGLPLFILSLMGKTLEVGFGNMEVIFALMGATILVLYFMMENDTLSKKQAIIMLGIYLIFLFYVISLAF